MNDDETEPRSKRDEFFKAASSELTIAALACALLLAGGGQAFAQDPPTKPRVDARASAFGTVDLYVFDLAWGFRGAEVRIYWCDAAAGSTSCTPSATPERTADEEAPVSNLRYTRTGVPHGRWSCYQVDYRPRDAFYELGDWSDKSDADCARTPGKPASPREVSAEPASPTSLNVLWDHTEGYSGAMPPNRSGYKIEACVGECTSAGSWTQVHDGAPDGRQEVPEGFDHWRWEHTGLSTGDVRSYRLKAYNPAGDSGLSGIGSGKLATPDPPGRLSAEAAAGPLRIDLSWRKPSGPVTGYRIEVCSGDATACAAAPAASWKKLADTEIGPCDIDPAECDRRDTSYSHTGVTKGETLSYRVRAHNLAGTSGPGAVVDATVPRPPGRPKNFRLQTHGAVAMILLWSAPDDDGGADEIGYRVEVCGPNAACGAEANWSLGSKGGSTAWTHWGLSRGDQWSYRVRAENVAGTSPPTRVGTATVGDPDSVSYATPEVNLVFSDTSIAVDEDDTADYTVALAAQPASTVTFSVTSGDTSAVTVSPASLTFTTSNWSTAQTVTVTGEQDADTDSESVTVRHAGRGVKDANVTVTASDDNGWMPTDLVFSDTSVAVDEDDTADYTVALAAQPASTVTVSVTSGDTSAVTVSPASLTFTTTDWSTPKPVTVTGEPDPDTVSETVTVTHSGAGVNDADVTVTVSDDDGGSTDVDLVFSPGRTVSVTEGATAEYTVALAAEPASTVTVSVTSADPDAVTVSPASLTFTTSDWSTPKPVTVTGEPDSDTDSETVTVTHSGAGVNDADVTVRVSDGDGGSADVDLVFSPGRTVSVTEGATAEYTVALAAEPASTVTVSVTSGDTSAVTVSPASLTFTTTDWRTPQTVTVTAEPDPDTDSGTVTVTHSGARVNDADVTVTISEDGGGESTPPEEEVFALNFAHFANGDGWTSDLVFVNPGSAPARPAIYLYDTGGGLVSAETVVNVTGDLTVREDGALTVLTAMAPLGELTISTHGRGPLVTGSVEVVSDGPMGGMLRFAHPGISEAVVGAGAPLGDAVFPARRTDGGITTGVAIHNLEEEALEVSCRLLRSGAVLEEASFALAANGQSSWLLDAAFSGTDTSGFSGSVHCATAGSGRFSALALEMDSGTLDFLTTPVSSVNRRAGGPASVLDFAHFANGKGWTSDLVFVNVSTQPSGPPLTPFGTAIPAVRPVIYFYDTGGDPISADSVMDITGDLTVQEDGALTVLTEMEPLEVLTVSTHGRGELLTGSVRVAAEGPLGGMLRYDHPNIGMGVAAASAPLGDALFPVRRTAGGITTGVAIHNLESSPSLVRCDLMSEGVLRDSVVIPLAANGQTSWLIDGRFPGVDTSDFSGSVRCAATDGSSFSAVVLEMDRARRIFTAVPVAPVPE